MEGFNIDTNQSIYENIKRILLNESDYIQIHCKEHPDVHYSIHEIRKSFKRIRAVLRMIRDEIGYSAYYRENIFYRDLSRHFSELRDYEVLINSLDELKKNYKTEMDRIGFEKIKKHLKVERDKLFEIKMGEEDIFEKVSGSLISGKERLHTFIPDQLNFKKCTLGIRRIYNRGIKLKSKASPEGALEIVHRFRKTTKYFQYMMQMLIPIYPDLLSAYVKSLKKLTDALGVYRDFGLLDHYLRNNRITGFPANKVNGLSKFINSERELIYKNSMYGAELVYTEDTDSFINRIIAYWNFNQKK